MKKIVRLLIVASVVVFIGGCASAYIQSTRDNSQSIDIEKLFIVIDHSAADMVDANYRKYLEMELKNQFHRENIMTQVLFVDKAKFNNKAYLEYLNSEINDFNPSAIMTMYVVGGQDCASGGLFEIHYDVSIYKDLECNRIWRAKLYACGGSKVYKKKMTRTVTKLIEKLNSDEMI